MSLLLEALKKAEKAKEEAQKRARPAAAPSGVALELEPAGEPTLAKHVMTRPELPDIRQPLEIVSEDLADNTQPEQRAASPAAQPRMVASAPSASRDAARQATAAEAAGAAVRATAKKVFEAKFKERDPRLPFYITVGVLGVFALGVVAYFWYQLRPPPPLVNVNAKRPPAEAMATAAPAASPPAQPASAMMAPQMPGLPPAPAKPAAPRDAETRPSTVVPVAAPTAAAAVAAPARPAVEPGTRAGLTFARPRAEIHPRVEAGYSAYLAGDLARAREHYEQAVREDATNRDALLGLAAVEARGGRYGAAEALYIRLLQADPRDAHAQAGLIGLRSGRIDPVMAESRVKSLLAAEPGAAVLQFTLGNQLAQQGRWPEAQQQYFKAFAAEPENPDFAYNLAVSLDQLRQAKPALDYYQRALQLAEKAGASFDARAARERVNQLSQ